VKVRGGFFKKENLRKKGLAVRKNEFSLDKLSSAFHNDRTYA
jgi:hypothetical protein